jgi:esterase/lipase superfamily enzyme
MYRFCVFFRFLVALVLSSLIAGCAAPGAGGQGEQAITEREVTQRDIAETLLPESAPEPVAPPAPVLIPAPMWGAFADGKARAGYALQTVYFATDRNVQAAAPLRFGVMQADQLSYGACVVSIPDVHKSGVLETPSIWKFEFSEDPKKHIVLLDVQKMDTGHYLDQIRRLVGRAPERNLFVFVHGFNVSFEDAARRTAQIAFDLHFKGAAIFYSWPSQGKLLPYPADETNAERTEVNLQQFLLDIAGKTGAENIYLIGHSMGNRPLTRALAEIAKSGKRIDGQIKELILAAPDIDVAVFKQQIAPFLTRAAQGITLYVSDRDKALMASEKLHRYPRAGQTRDLVVMAGMDTVDASLVDTDFLGHAYFVQNRALLTDIAYILNDHFRADKRAGLHRVRRSDAIVYWQFDR